MAARDGAFVRPARRPMNLPVLWDDLWRFPLRSWKKHRKSQFKSPSGMARNIPEIKEKTMPENVFAFTAPGGSYPEYVSVNETDDPDQFTITVRSKPTTTHGAYVCGYPRDKGQPGRCTPGDDRCNNYCNLAPEKGPMVDHPLPAEHIREGTTAMITLTMRQMEELAGAIIRASTGAAV